MKDSRYHILFLLFFPFFAVSMNRDEETKKQQLVLCNTRSQILFKYNKLLKEVENSKNSIIHGEKVTVVMKDKASLPFYCVYNHQNYRDRQPIITINGCGDYGQIISRNASLQFTLNKTTFPKLLSTISTKLKDKITAIQKGHDKQIMPSNNVTWSLSTLLTEINKQQVAIGKKKYFLKSSIPDIPDRFFLSEKCKELLDVSPYLRTYYKNLLSGAYENYFSVSSRELPKEQLLNYNNLGREIQNIKEEIENESKDWEVEQQLNEIKNKLRICEEWYQKKLDVGFFDVTTNFEKIIGELTEENEEAIRKLTKENDGAIRELTEEKDEEITEVIEKNKGAIKLVRRLLEMNKKARETVKQCKAEHDEELKKSKKWYFLSGVTSALCVALVAALIGGFFEGLFGTEELHLFLRLIR